MTRDLESICYITKLIANARPWDLDPTCVPIVWNESAFHEVQNRPMVIGLILDDGVVKVHPPISRALRTLAEALEAAGHEVVDWDTSEHAACNDLVNVFFTVDGGEDIRRDVEAGGEPYIPYIEELVNRGKAVSVYESWQLNKQRSAMQKRYLDKWNRVRSTSGKPVDVILSPTLAHTSVPHRQSHWTGYTKVWSLLDYPSLTFPVSKVSASRDHKDAEPHAPRNEIDEKVWNLYDAAEVDGYPVNLQITGKRFEEEKVLGAATAIERVWHSRQN